MARHKWNKISTIWKFDYCTQCNGIRASIFHDFGIKVLYIEDDMAYNNSIPCKQTISDINKEYLEKIKQLITNCKETNLFLNERKVVKHK